MPTTRRRWAAALAIALGLGAASACSVKSDTGGGGASGGKEITFLVFETPNLTPQVWDANIKRVTDKYPDIKVKKIVSPTEDRTAYAKQLLTSGQFPDVMIAVSPTGFAEAGKLYAWKPDELKQFTHPDQGAVNGKVYQLPANTQTIPVVYYNKDLFAKAGLPGPPKNYAEFLDDCAKLKAKGIKPLVVGGGHDALGPTWAGVLGTEVYAKNPNWMHDRRAGKVEFTGPEFVKGAQKLADLAAKGYIDKRDLALDYPKTQQAFLDGKGAMYAMGNWFAAAADNPETKPDFGVGQFFWPSDDGGQVVPAFTGGGLLVSSSAKNLEAAKKFALAYQLDKTNLDTSAVSDGLIPAVTGYTPPAKAGPVYQDGYRQYEQAAKAGAVVPAFGFESGDDGMPAGVVDKWDSAAQDLVTGRRTAQEVAKFLDTEWSKAS
ncbi:extracellular solute-binding protein [Actinomadura darangshiensis]|uniref:Extracellular solute-binding protein n=1 Tax=Actinomadura darangshiensis TaxID=705336 RepID=A0A4R5BVQ2_9ACTN|nr:extracellular solute-binding protein [Actinomadura darangshiensis]TDD88324.1 extracellular solute-binding protein [Actinomadura darangshiensis]